MNRESSASSPLILLRYDVDTATSATRAVEMFEHHPPDAVFLDIKGLTLLKFLLCSKVVLKPRR
jgi:CheY-like chemotaxis protein